jgi:hypothetical protein
MQMMLFCKEKLVPDLVPDLAKNPLKEAKYGKSKSILITEVIECQ